MHFHPKADIERFYLQRKADEHGNFSTETKNEDVMETRNKKKLSA